VPQIVVENLRKTFQVAVRRPGFFGAIRGVLQREHRTVHALDGVSFAIEPGELVGYVGPNGAGKSTTIKILSGILVPGVGGNAAFNTTPILIGARRTHPILPCTLPRGLSDLRDTPRQRWVPG
jgi:ABC-type uncharacterized transport system ATPase subunit